MYGFHPLGLLSVSLLVTQTTVAACPGSWTELKYEARKALVLGAEVSLRAGPAEVTELADVAGAGGDVLRLPAPSPCLVRLSSDARFAGRTSVRTLWLDARTPEVLQVDDRKSKRWKRRRFTPRGHHQWRASPARGERRRAPEHWTRRSERAVDWPVPDDLGTLDAQALLYLAPALRLDRAGARHAAATWTRGRPWRIELSAEGEGTVDVDFRRERPGRPPERVRRALPVRRALLSAEPLVPSDDDDESFEMFGLRGPVEVYLELGTGLPVELRGGLPAVGRVHVKLKRAVLP